MAKKLNIGLFGFGCVGQGLYHVLQNSTGFRANISRIVVKNKNKTRTLAKHLLSYDKSDILEDPDIDVVVELIDDAEEAYHIVSAALKSGKHVVTANKKLLALHLNELIQLQKQHGVSLLYEGAVCGSIPVIRTLEEYFDNESIESVSGIFNGTSNFILSKTINEKMSYAKALLQAQELGFAETDPASDVEGLDPKFKAVIVALHAFGLVINPDQVLNLGISHLQEPDIVYAREKGYKIKLVPVIKKLPENRVCIFVAPQFVKPVSPLFHVDQEFNAVVLEGKFSGEQFLKGRGAGSYPTGAAVLSDNSALSHGYKYEYKKYEQTEDLAFSNAASVSVYLRYNTVLDLENIEFGEITEKYKGQDFKYVVGNISLESLLKSKAYISEQRLFLALVNDQVSACQVHNRQQQNKIITSKT